MKKIAKKFDIYDLTFMQICGTLNDIKQTRFDLEML